MQKNFVQELGGAYSVEYFPESNSKGNFLMDVFIFLIEKTGVYSGERKKKDHLGRSRGQRILETLRFEECQREIKGLHYKAFPTPLFL